MELLGDGKQAIAPGSLHAKSGELVRWDKHASPTIVRYVDLRVAVEKLAEAVQKRLEAGIERPEYADADFCSASSAYSGHPKATVMGDTDGGEKWWWPGVDFENDRRLAEFCAVKARGQRRSRVHALGRGAALNRGYKAAGMPAGQLMKIVFEPWWIMSAPYVDPHDVRAKSDAAEQFQWSYSTATHPLRHDISVGDDPVPVAFQRARDRMVGDIGDIPGAEWFDDRDLLLLLTAMQELGSMCAGRVFGLTRRQVAQHVFWDGADRPENDNEPTWKRACSEAKRIIGRVSNDGSHAKIEKRGLPNSRGGIDTGTVWKWIGVPAPTSRSRR